MTANRRRRCIGVAAILAITLAACGSSGSPPTTGASGATTTIAAVPSLAAPVTTVTTVNTIAPSSTAPCTGRPAPATYAHVLVIVMENHDFEQVAGHSPYLNTLASQCGLATSSHGVAHPSLPNYIALTSGGTQGITTDCTSCSTGAASIFGQVGPTGWKSYEEGMPTPGFTGTSSGGYAKRHNPAAYFTAVAPAFATQSVPMGTPDGGPLLTDLTADSLPRFSFLTPDLCNDEHDCPVATGDAWLATWVPKILDSPAYRAGTTALFITYDENDNRADNHVYTVAVSPSVPAATTSAAAFDHYSLLATVEDLLGVPRLGSAMSATPMRAALHV